MKRSRPVPDLGIRIGQALDEEPGYIRVHRTLGYRTRHVPEKEISTNRCQQDSTSYGSGKNVEDLWDLKLSLTQKTVFIH